MRAMSRTRKLVATGAVAGGLLLGVAGVAGAASTATASSGTSSSTAASTAASSTATRPATGPGDPATAAHGPGETLLTGSTAASVKSAALAAVPGGTIVRVESDSAGSPYEAHVKKADGTYVTVKIDAAFKVTAIQQGFGAGPAGTAAGGPAA